MNSDRRVETVYTGRSMSRLTRWYAAAFGALLGIATGAQAASIYWDGVNGSWGDTNNWSTAAGATTPDPDAVPGLADIAIFNVTGGDAGIAVTLDADREAATLTFTNTGASTLRANASGTTARTLTLGAGINVNTNAGPVSIGSEPGTYGELGIVLTNNVSVIVMGGTALTLDGVVGGDRALSMIFPSAGMTILNRANTHAYTALEAGNMTLGDDQALGRGVFQWKQGFIYAAKPLVITNDIDLTSNTPRFAGTNDIALNGNLTFVRGTNAANRQINVENTGGTAVTLNGNLYLNNVTDASVASTSTLQVIGAMVITGTIADYTGGVAASAAVLRKTSAGPLTLSGSNTFSRGFEMTTSAGKLNINNNYALGTGYFTIGGASSIDNTSGSDVTLMNNNPITMPTQFTFPGNGNLNLGAGPVTMTGNLQINATNNNLTIGGPMSGPYTLLKTQPGTLTLAGANSYTGNTSVTGGKLKLGANEVIPDGAGKGDIAVTGSAIILDMNGFSETVNALSGTGIIDNSVPGTTSILTVCNDNDTTNFTGSLRNTGGTLALTKAGSGQWTLSGTLNTYSGVTHVAAGTLALSGTGTLASTQIVVSAGATFSVTGRTATARMFLLASNQALLGGGTVEGSVTNSGVVAPGLSAGNLTISEDYGQRTNGALSIEIGGTVAGTTYDVLTVTGAATLNGALNVSPINGYAPASGASFTVLQAASVAGVFASTNLPTLTSGLGWEVTYPGAAVVLSVTGTASGATGYDQWAGAITNGLTNYNDSATGDGYPNLLKYATGSSPTNADNLARMGCTRTSGVFALTFNRNTNALDVTLVVEGSDSVKNDSTWSGIATNKIGAWNPPTVSEAGSGTPVAVTVKDNAASGTNRFLRLRVTRP